MKAIHAVLLAASAAIAPASHAAWTLLTLPNTTSWDNTALTLLPDGRFLYGHNGALYRQDTFGLPSVTRFANDPAGDYAFVTPKHLGRTSGTVYSYDNNNTASAFTEIANSLAPYAGVNYPGGGLLATGLAGGDSDLFHVSPSGVVTTLINGVSAWSGGLTLDGSGNLYLANPGDGGIYRFSSSQIASSILGGSLTMGDGTFIANLGMTASLAFDDSTNRLFAAGWSPTLTGIRMFDLSTKASSGFIPAGNDSNYSVHAFSDGSNSYVGWLHRSGWNGVDSMTFGYDFSANVPEPSAAFLVAAGAFGLALRRRRKEPNAS